MEQSLYSVKVRKFSDVVTHNNLKIKNPLWTQHLAKEIFMQVVKMPTEFLDACVEVKKERDKLMVNDAQIKKCLVSKSQI